MLLLLCGQLFVLKPSTSTHQASHRKPTPARYEKESWLAMYLAAWLLLKMDLWFTEYAL
jgi:hypothetical protein